MICRPVAMAKTLSVVLGCMFSFSSAAFAQLSVTGILRPVEEVVIKSELAGLVQRVAVKEGDHVKEGQLLIELERAPEDQPRAVSNRHPESQSGRG